MLTLRPVLSGEDASEEDLSQQKKQGAYLMIFDDN